MLKKNFRRTPKAWIWPVEKSGAVGELAGSGIAGSQHRSNHL